MVQLARSKASLSALPLWRGPGSVTSRIINWTKELSKAPVFTGSYYGIHSRSSSSLCTAIAFHLAPVPCTQKEIWKWVTMDFCRAAKRMPYDPVSDGTILTVGQYHQRYRIKLLLLPGGRSSLSTRMTMRAKVSSGSPPLLN